MIVGHCLSNVHINHLGNLVRLQILIQKGWGGGDGLVAQLSLTLTPWTVACQAPLSVEFSRQEYWSGLPFFSPGDLPYLGIEPRSPAL